MTREIYLDKTEDGLAFIALDRPGRMNALGRRLVEELARALQAFCDRDHVQCPRRDLCVGRLYQ